MNANSLNLTASAWQLVTERPPVWEYRLFAQVLCDEIERSKPLLLSPTLGTRASVPLNEVFQWLSARIDAFKRIMADMVTAGNAKQDNVFGSSSVPGDVGNIVAFSRRIVAHYRQATCAYQSAHRYHSSLFRCTRVLLRHLYAGLCSLVCLEGVLKIPVAVSKAT